MKLRIGVVRRLPPTGRRGMAAVLVVASAAAALAVSWPSVRGAAFASRPHAGTQQVSLALDWYPNSDHAGLYTAIQRGFFQRRGLDVRPYVPANSTAQLTLVAAGKADFGITYETDQLAARVHRLPVRSVMCIMQHPLNTVMALKSSGITRPRQLVGKSVGMAGSPSDQPVVAALMRADGASIRQTRMVNVGYKLLPVLIAGKVDAVVGVYWTWEAIQAQEQGHPVNVMRVERWSVPNYCELVLVASEETIRTRPQLVRNTVQGLQQGYAYAEAHPDAGWRALYAADRTLARERNLILRSEALLRPIVTGTRTVGWQDGGQWARYAAWLDRNKLISGPVDASKAFTNRFLAPSVR